ncbi:hypothetical protein QYE76_058399 [Lolium multiflorum]|uniref:AP2/ERF domain-containing protein n=1 Tax=Lolium multiflorum TaxID=4521 RepID=A0AAD8WSF0_LOLMU|nr:hypothetical protein QYE76_058399 [Lolium multiflorum]
MAPRRRSNTGFIGVRLRPAGHFAAEITAGGTRVWLGTFYTKEAAARAYVAAWRFGRPRHEMNFPRSGLDGARVSLLSHYFAHGVKRGGTGLASGGLIPPRRTSSSWHSGAETIPETSRQRAHSEGEADVQEREEGGKAAEEGRGKTKKCAYLAVPTAAVVPWVTVGTEAGPSIRRGRRPPLRRGLPSAHAGGAVTLTAGPSCERVQTVADVPTVTFGLHLAVPTAEVAPRVAVGVPCVVPTAPLCRRREMNHIATGTAPSLDGELLLLMGAATVMKMAAKMAAVSMEKPSGALPRPGGVPNRDSCPQDLGFAMAAARKVSWVSSNVSGFSTEALNRRRGGAGG